MNRRLALLRPSVLVFTVIAVLGSGAVAAAEHLKRHRGGDDVVWFDYYMGTGDPDNDRHIHSFTEVSGGSHCDQWRDGKCRNEMDVEIRRADKRYANSYEPGPRGTCKECRHVHVGLNTRYAECHYYTKHWYHFDAETAVTFHHDWCGAIRS